MLAPASQGRGYATEAVLHVSNYLFRVEHAHRVTTTCDERNAPVARVLLRVGMRAESRQVEGDYSKGERTTIYGYALLARDLAS